MAYQEQAGVGLIQSRGQLVSILPAKLPRLASVQAFARRRWPLTAALLVLLASGSAMVGSGGTAALARVIEDPLSLLADRSPGGRGEGAQFATKHRKVVQDAVDSVLPLAREHTPPAAELPVSDGGVPGIALDPLLTPVQAGPPAEAVPEIAALTPPGGPVIGGGNPGNPGIIIPIGGDPGSPPGTPTDPDPPIVPAIPEPSTWALLIMGFFMVGASLRARANDAAIHRAG